jgi:parallel beta-helix repeat protein
MLDGWLTLTNWNEIKPNIWAASSSFLNVQPIALRINHVMLPLGRFPQKESPNGGFLPITLLSNGLKTMFIDTTLLHSNQDWSGAEAVVRADRWIMNRIVIAQQKSDTLLLSKAASNLKPHFGYFIQNHPATLTYNGAWYYNSSSHEVWLYSTENPNNKNIQVANQDYTFVIIRQSNIIIDGFAVTGSKENSVNFIQSKVCKIQNCNFNQLGKNAIAFGTYSDLSNDSISITNNQFTDIQSSAIVAYGNHVDINNNKISTIALSPGMLNDPGMGINVLADGLKIEKNTLDSIGYIPIDFGWSSHAVINMNFITNFCSVLDDGGGIYSWDGQKNYPIDRVVKHNIILHGIGAPYGTDGTRRSVEGIYLDDCSPNVAVDNNTIAYCPDAGIFVHDAADNRIENNTIFSCGKGILMVNLPTSQIVHCYIEHNTIVSNDPDGDAALLEFSVIQSSELSQFGTLDHNLFCQPFLSPDYIRYHATSSGIINRMDLTSWQRESGYDLHSKMFQVHFPLYSKLVSTYNIFDGKVLTESKNRWKKDDPQGNVSTLKVIPGSKPSIAFGVTQGNKDSNLSTSLPTIQSGHTYMMNISLKGDSCSQIYSYITNGNSALASTWFYPSPINKTYEFCFTAKENISTPILNIAFGPSDRTKGIVYIDLLQFDKVVPVDNNNRFHLEYNISPDVHTIQLKKGEMVVSENSNLQSNIIFIPPFSSMIIVK